MNNHPTIPVNQSQQRETLFPLVVQTIRYAFVIWPFLFLALTLASCSKNKSESTDRDNPVITLTSLSDEQVFTGSQTINITGTVTDNRYIKEIHIEISDLDSGEEYLHVHIHPASASYNYDQPYLLTAGNNYRIRVIADDASTNSSVRSVNVRCN
ncbi:MAG: DUF4625 domain-containing protein [Chitinophagaceae bacterium]|nr:MAG: DUF4625 domain-containing protein [Chitinophagaceae bacterium]